MVPVPVLLEYLVDVPAADEELIARLEAAAVAYLERQTGRYFGEPAEVVEWFDGNGTARQWLRDVPTAGGVVVADGDDELDPDSYDARGRLLVRSARWAYGREYSATYTRGYAEGDGPPDIMFAVMQLVALMYEVRVPVITGETASKAHDLVGDVVSSWRGVTV